VEGHGRPRRSISPNAHFITLHEICRPPQSAGVTVAQQAEMVRYWAADFEHPLKPIMVGFAVARIEGRSLPVEYVIRVMDEIAHHHKGEWGALAIALSGRDDEDGVADARFDEIKASWEYDG
jgi:hypothetical protein